MSDAPVTTSAKAAPPEDAASAIEHMLPLAWLVAIAGFVDLAWNRIAVVALEGDGALWLLRTGPLWRNLAAVGGLVAIVVGLFTYLRMAGFAGPLRRMQIAALSGLLVPSLVLALVVAKEALPPPVVLVSMGVGNTVVVLFGVTSGGYLKSPFRAGVWGAAFVSILVLVLLVATSFEALGLGTGEGEPLSSGVVWTLLFSCRWLGEALWLALPLVVGRALVRSEPFGPPARVVAAVMLFLVLAAAAVGELHVHPDFRVIAYGAFRVTLLPEALIGLYAIPIGLSIALASGALATGSPRARQVGVFALTWVAAGFAPRTPIQMIYLVVAMLSIARAVQATDPEGRRLARLPWGEPRERPTPKPVPQPMEALAKELDDAPAASDAETPDAPEKSDAVTVAPEPEAADAPPSDDGRTSAPR